MVSHLAIFFDKQKTCYPVTLEFCNSYFLCQNMCPIIDSNLANFQQHSYSQPLFLLDELYFSLD